MRRFYQNSMTCTEQLLQSLKNHTCASRHGWPSLLPGQDVYKKHVGQTEEFIALYRPAPLPKLPHVMMYMYTNLLYCECCICDSVSKARPFTRTDIMSSPSSSLRLVDMFETYKGTTFPGLRVQTCTFCCHSAYLKSPLWQTPQKCQVVLCLYR